MDRAHPLPARLGKYEILSKIGDGGMASVYLASLRAQLDANRAEQHASAAVKQVALKVIHPHLNTHRDFILMFFDEVRLAMELSHRNIVQTFDAGRQDEHHYYVMELVQGCSLRMLLNRIQADGVALPVELALFIGMEVCAALQYAHTFRAEEGGVIHRDISPSNVLLSAQGEVKLADFGVAKAARGLAFTSADLIKGKLNYMAPEQARGLVDARSDLFSVGALLFESLCGRSIRQEATLDRVRSGKLQLPNPTSLRSEIGTKLAGLLHSCLADAIEDRPASAEVLRRALNEDVFRRQLVGGGSRDLHADLRAFLAERPGLTSTYGKKGLEKRPVDARGEDLARAVLAQALEVATDHGELSSSFSCSLSDDEEETLAFEQPPPNDEQREQEQDQDSIVVAAQPRRSGLPVARRIVIAAIVAVAFAVAVGVWWRGGDDVEITPDASVSKSPDSAFRVPDSSPAVDVKSAAAPLDASVPTKRRPSRKRPPRRISLKKIPGYLDVNAVPWAELYVDGKHLGQTPVQRITLRPGPHRVRLINRRWKLDRTFTVRVVAGKRLRKVFHLQ